MQLGRSLRGLLVAPSWASPPPPAAALVVGLLLLAQFCLCTVLAGSEAAAQGGVVGRQKRSFAFSRFFTKGRGPTGGGGSKEIKGQAPTFRGGCGTRPLNPPHTTIQCHTHSGCRLTCLRDYVFPNGERRIITTCNNGKWEVEDTDWSFIPDCVPECHPPCQNNGICVKPNVCNCSESYVGPQCQYNRRPCLNDSPLPANSLKRCNPKACTITCVEGHTFPDGSAITNLVCRDGTWSPARKDWTSVPDCQPTCNPPCQNGGNCLSYNSCECPQDYRGPQCQYSKEVCNPKKLNFNGHYKCTGNSNTLTCHLKCPAGQFSFEPADIYKCEYATGAFLPAPIPQCIYDTVVEMIPRVSSVGSHMFTIETEKKKETSFLKHSNWTRILNKIPLHLGEVIHTTLEKLPSPGSCYVWGDHYKTFDGKVLSFKSNCSYTLVQDAVDNTFSVLLDAPRNGSRFVKVFAQDKVYTLLRNEHGLPILGLGSRVFNIPTQLPGVIVNYRAHLVEFTVTLAGFSVIWDTLSAVTINVKEHLWNRTAGLCGRIDGYHENDMQMKDGQIASHITPFASSWQVEPLGEICTSSIQESNPCDSPSDSLASEATAFCNKILSDPHFSPCRSVIEVHQYFEACRWDFCSCRSESMSNNSNECACRSIATFVKECNFHDIAVLNWRDSLPCPMICTGGRVYMSCNPEIQPSCGSEEETEEKSIPLRNRKGSQHCVEGCYCPRGTVLFEQKCITRELCPCQLQGRFYPPGHTIPKDCNTCTCDNGRWKCTQTLCSARCSAIGDPHYTTFDGKRYDFMGKCSYYLVKGKNYSIEAENVACSGAISKNMGFLKYNNGISPSCTKSVTIRVGARKIQLKQNNEILMDEIQVTKFPTEVEGTLVYPVSSIFMIVKLSNNLTVWWDGVSRIYIDAPPSFHGETRGLCGTFTVNQKEDFLTPEEDVEQSVIAFANKWKTNEQCPNEPEIELPSPCDINLHKKEDAEKFCSAINSPIFERCHGMVDPDPFYHNCMYDMCSCEQNVGLCLCPIIAAYAKECTRKGIHIDWRSNIRECGLHCLNSQRYQLCGNTCTRSCGTISLNPNCERECVEGCNCPEDQTLNDETGECIPVSECPCQYKGMAFQPGQKEIRPSLRGPQLCTCLNALWSCKAATAEEIKLYPDSATIKHNCSAQNNEEYLSCLPTSALTCKTMHSAKIVPPSVCKGGCFCKKGYVLDQESKRCMRPYECPCHHGGKSYSEGNSIQEDCNTCVCKSGKWKCTERVCAGICSAWGDSHFKTFDSRIFDFHGTCDYLFAKATLSSEESFDVIIQNVECGSSGVSCSKSVTLKVGIGNSQEIITFSRDKILPEITGLERIQLRRAGLFVFAEVTDLGIVLQWDQGTLLYLKVDPRWKGKIKGLCGNYNDDMLDDFQTPSGGIAETSATLFGDSWRLQAYCPVSINISDACVQHPNRKLWAMQKCGVLKSTIFQSCHSEVPVEPYLERCIFDSCACDMGGDCDCLCTAVAAYTHECNAHGVHIKWRSQSLCPMQCDEKCSSYSPCVETCPKTTCENQFIINGLNQLCKEDTCVEGCELNPCPPGQVYLNKTALECVPIASCKTVCLEENGITYYEGDLMEEDECHSCYCSRHKKSCKGIPCSTTFQPTSTPDTTTVLAADRSIQCKDGWTNWINNNHRNKSKFDALEKEPMPSQDFLSDLAGSSAYCSLSQVEAIECQVASSHVSHKDTGLNVSCDTDDGLVCHGNECPDFEIRVFCNCESSTPGNFCDPVHPNKAHPENCHSFYQCVNTINGTRLIEKNCGPDMMYNIDTQVCDHPSSVAVKRPECSIIESSTSTTIFSGLGVTPKECKAGDVWKSCGISCDQVCLYYNFILTRKGFCSTPDSCIEGCFHEELSGGCPPGYMWRDDETCVSASDCTCYSDSGDPVKPGEVKYEADCKVCQCINNQYICDSTKCEETTSEAAIVTEEVPTMGSGNLVMFPSTSTPPLPCKESNFVPLVHGISPLSNAAFHASSLRKGIDQKPFFAQITNNSKTDNAWIPAEQNKNQFLQINIGTVKPIYGVSVKGGLSGFVTSYRVLYSLGGDVFHSVKAQGTNNYDFRGPTDYSTPFAQVFEPPVEAQYVRFVPQTWHNEISMNVEIYGCMEDIPANEFTTIDTMYSTTETIPASSIFYSTASIECMDEMGLDDGLLNDQQITLSSIKDNNIDKYGPSQVHLSAMTEVIGGKAGSWMPSLNDKNQWIQFDFLEPRNLSGFITKGSANTNDWVEAFKIFYSHDGTTWNPYFNDEGKEKIFPGNYDASSTQQNTFGRILRCRYLRLAPFKWHRNIAVRAEIIGCFEPYPSITNMPSSTSIFSVPTSAPECQICEGVASEKALIDGCLKCSPDLWWDGDKCINKTHCPCFVNHVRYDVGKVYETEECNECICKLNGIHDCKLKECKKTCPPGQQKVLTAVCGCTCKPCPEGTILCPSSNICINETFWCNGIEDCPDDERNCPVILSSPAPDSLTTSCPLISCPPGTKPIKMSSLVGHNKSKGLKGTLKKGVKGKRLFDLQTYQITSIATECEPIKCVPIIQPTTERPTSCLNVKPKCGASSIVVRIPSTDACPIFECVPRHGICNVTKNTIDTFDGIEFKHDFCNHILVRDSHEKKWNISIIKDCSKKVFCTTYLNIIQDIHSIKLYPDLSIELDGIFYTSKETKRLGSKKKPYGLFHVGNSLIFQSHRYGFWAIWDSEQNVKIGVTAKLFGAVEGLCGTLNRNPDDDRTTPEGKIAKSNIDFVKSWTIPGSSECEATKCPHHVQIQAQEICNSIRTSSLAICKSALDIERFVARCMESTCLCLTSEPSDSTRTQECRCSALQGFVTTCQSIDASMDLTGWRTEHSCMVQCPPSSIYHDCYRRKCEPTCGLSPEIETCDVIPGTCFTGCFCPDGLLRHNDQCISPDECRDCVCDGFGDQQYMTFDRSNFTFNGNCTYVASQDYNHTYQVLITNHRCEDEPTSSCTTAVEVHFMNNSVQIKYESKEMKNIQLVTSVNGNSVNRFPHKENNWLQLRRVENSEVTIFIPPIQLEVTYIFHSYAFTIRLPSSTFKNKTEGLCGNCNRIKADDFKTSSGKITNDSNEFGLSWLATKHDNCTVIASGVSCEPLPPEEDPCLRLYDSSVFKKCHIILDPAPYVAACQFDICQSLNSTDAACRDMEAYVSACEREGICLNWRSPDVCPFECPEGREYRACQPGCSGTCEINGHFTSNCSSLVPDGCYCTDNRVLRDNECVEKAKCFSCEEGYFDGDSWQQDKCTNCTCVGSRKECQQLICSDVKTICKEGMMAVESEESDKECCRKITCVPAPLPTKTTCSPPQTPLCQDDQKATSIVGEDGCITIVCKCKPCKTKLWIMEDEGIGGGEVEVESEEETEELGVKIETDTSGCCPKKIRRCYPESCPPQTCKYPLVPRNLTNDSRCCVSYECVPPPNSCLIEDKITKEIIVKKVGSKWQDGPCQTCTCKEFSGVPESTCNKVMCPAEDINQNVTQNYVTESRREPEECCPSINYVACKVNDSILEPGKTVTHYHSDYCVTYICKTSIKGIERVLETERCNTVCKLGWKYIKPEVESGQCCGECKPVGCIHDGQLRNQGEKWMSSDSCIEYTCSLKNGTVQVDTVTMNCPEISEEMQNDYLIDERKEPNKCCKSPVFLGCKHHGEIYEAGETWQSAQNPCKKYSCEYLPNGQLLKKESMETCSSNCSQGWEYVPATLGSRQCCGQCQQTACEFEDRVYPPNASWQSQDECTNYTCAVTSNGQFQVVSSYEQCPSVISCPPENIYKDKCCRKCKIAPLSSLRECELKNVPSHKSLVKEVYNNHGHCINEQFSGFSGFTECKGTCFSETTYNSGLDSYVKACNCCQPDKYERLNIPMLCTDGYRYNKTINIPSGCTCLECSEKAPRKHRPVY